MSDCSTCGGVEKCSSPREWAILLLSGRFTTTRNLYGSLCSCVPDEVFDWMTSDSLWPIFHSNFLGAIKFNPSHSSELKSTLSSCLWPCSLLNLRISASFFLALYFYLIVPSFFKFPLVKCSPFVSFCLSSCLPLSSSLIPSHINAYSLLTSTPDCTCLFFLF